MITDQDIWDATNTDKLDRRSIRKCDHDLAGRETACADGLCPLCLRTELAAVRERVARLVGAIEKLLACPCIADRDLEPAWLCSETAEAVAFARTALEDK